MLLVYVIGWSVVTVLVAFLCRRHVDRMRPTKIVLDGTAMDVGPVFERVQRLRQDYVGGARKRSNDRSRREAIHLAARQMVRSFSYVKQLEGNCERNLPAETQAHAA